MAILDPLLLFLVGLTSSQCVTIIVAAVLPQSNAPRWGGPTGEQRGNRTEAPCSATTQSRPESHPAKWKIAESSIELGELLQNEVRSGSIHIVNVGDDPITISNITASCTCVVPQSAKKSTVPPHSSIQLPFEFHAVDRSGPVTQSIAVFPEQGEAISCSIRALVKSRLKGMPVEVSFGEVVHGSTLSREYIIGLPNEEIENVTAKGSTDFLVVDVKREGDCARLSLVLFAPRDPKVETRKIELLFDLKSGARRTFEIPVALRSVPPVEVAPSALYLGSIRKSGGFKKTLRIRVREESLTDIRATSSADWMEANVVREPDGIYSVRLSCKAGTAPVGRVEALLSIIASGAGRYEISVPVLGSVME